MGKPTDLVQGTLDLLILKTLALEPMHGWGIAQRIRQVSKEVLQVNQGALYPALHRLEQSGWIKANRGRVGQQSPGQVLFAHAGRPPVLGARARQLATAFRRYRAGAGNILTIVDFRLPIFD